jgi:soluble lytic murein transglycosylase-like protein
MTLRLSICGFVWLTLLFPLGNIATAAVYQYADENGSLHFTNVPTDPQYQMILPPDKGAGSSQGSAARKKYTAADFEKLVADRSQRHGMDPKLVEAVIQVESEYNPRAISSKGAQGLMQLMPETARDLGVQNAFDPAQNIDGGVRYLRYLLDFFGWDLDLALAAYNAGINRVLKHHEVPHIVETQAYVKKVKKTYDRKPSSLPPPPRREIVHRVISETGDVVFTNTPEAYESY